MQARTRDDCQSLGCEMLSPVYSRGLQRADVLSLGELSQQVVLQRRIASLRNLQIVIGINQMSAARLWRFETRKKLSTAVADDRRIPRRNVNGPASPPARVYAMPIAGDLTLDSPRVNSLSSWKHMKLKVDDFCMRREMSRERLHACASMQTKARPSRAERCPQCHSLTQTKK